MAKTSSRRASRKRATHDRIVASAGRIVRRKGLVAASVSRVMRGAGLTVGGFYAHFRSKRAMDAEVVRAALDGWLERWLSGLDDRQGLAFVEAAVSRYLSLKHRDDFEKSCSLPSIVSEVARADDATRAVTAAAIDARVQALARQTPAANGCSPRERALATLSLCVGGLVLARAARGHEISDELLAASRKWALPDA